MRWSAVGVSFSLVTILCYEMKGSGCVVLSCYNLCAMSWRALGMLFSLVTISVLWVEGHWMCCFLLLQSLCYELKGSGCVFFSCYNLCAMSWRALDVFFFLVTISVLWVEGLWMCVFFLLQSLCYELKGSGCVCFSCYNLCAMSWRALDVVFFLVTISVLWVEGHWMCCSLLLQSLCSSCPWVTLLVEPLSVDVSCVVVDHVQHSELVAEYLLFQILPLGVCQVWLCCLRCSFFNTAVSFWLCMPQTVDAYSMAGIAIVLLIAAWTSGVQIWKFCSKKPTALFPLPAVEWTC